MRLVAPRRYRLAASALSVGAAGLVFSASAQAANPTKLSISCTPNALSPAVTATCNATVTDSGSAASRVPPTGTVTFTVEGAGTLDPAEGCLLEEFGAFSSRCTITYAPTEIAGGTHRLLGTYGGDDGHGRATAQFTLDVAPLNDELDNAAPLRVPAKLKGTTDGATWNYSDDPELCGDAWGPVWYALRPAREGRVAVRLTVRGRVDSVVAVFRQDRSKLEDMGCALTDRAGVAGVAFDAERGTTYLIAVAAPWDARVGGFTLETSNVPAASVPGNRLVRDADLKLDPLLRPSAVLSIVLRPGVTYRVNATGSAGCVVLTLLRPDASSAEDAPIRRSSGCSGYLVHTADREINGRFALVVSLAEGVPQPIHVALRRAEADDLAPGLPLASGQTRRGRLDARSADTVDVFGFRVDARGDATVTLVGAVHAELLILNARGARLACACEGAKVAAAVSRLAPGAYFAIVRGRPGATGGYTIGLRVRVPTTVDLRLRHGTGQQQGFRAEAAVAPEVVAGRIVFEVEQFDPLTRWHFVAAATRRIADGRALLVITRPPGRWRVRARYTGTLASSPGVSRWIRFAIEPVATR